MPRHAAPPATTPATDRRDARLLAAALILAVLAVGGALAWRTASGGGGGQQSRVALSPSSVSARRVSPSVDAPDAFMATSGLGRADAAGPSPGRSRAGGKPTLVYTVQPGDNLTVIASWFKARGFEPVYAWNKTVIGRNPDLIFPGQKIIVVPGDATQVSVDKPS